MSTTTYQPETRTLAQIKRDYHRSLHPTAVQSLKNGAARFGKAIARGIVYLLLALIFAFFLNFVVGPILAGISVPVLLFLLIMNS